MHLGLIGGIGVAATVVYYQRLARAVDAMGVPMQLTIAHGDIRATATVLVAADRNQPGHSSAAWRSFWRR